MDHLNVIVTHPFLMLWAGQLLHMLKEVKEVETHVPGITLGLYAKRHRYGVAFSVIAGLVVYAILYQMGELSPLSAFMAGYMSESVINAAASRVTRKVSGDEFGFSPGMDGGSNFEERPYDYYDWYKAKGVGSQVGAASPAADGDSRDGVLDGREECGSGSDADDHHPASRGRDCERGEGGEAGEPRSYAGRSYGTSGQEDRGGNQ